ILVVPTFSGPSHIQALPLNHNVKPASDSTPTQRPGTGRFLETDHEMGTESDKSTRRPDQRRFIDTNHEIIPRCDKSTRRPGTAPFLETMWRSA
ncbi:hypothetical protein LSAT2_002681, partial [Lamellibrachia satsuma]